MATRAGDSRFSRRQLIAVSGSLALTPAIAGLLAACSSTPAAPSTSATTSGGTTSGATAAPAASANTSQTSSELVFWFPTQQYAEIILNDYKKAQPNVKLKWELGEYDTNTKTMAALAAGNPPPMSYLGRWQAPSLAVKNAIYSLDDRIKGATSWKWDDVWSRLQTQSIFWGRKWIVPYTTDTRGFYYNKDLMEKVGLDPEKPPKTWPDLITQAVKATTKNGAGRIDTIGFTPTFGNPPDQLMFYSMLWMMDSSVVNDDHTKVTMLDKGTEALTAAKDLMDKQGGYKVASAFTKGLTLSKGLDAFSIGKVVFASNTSGPIVNYTKYSPKLNYNVISGFTYPPYTEHYNYDGGGGWFYFKKGYKNGTSPDDAWQFTEFLMGKDFYTNLVDVWGTIPALRPVGEAWAKLGKFRDVFISTANTVRWEPILVDDKTFNAPIATMWDDVMFEKSSIDTALHNAATSMQKVLDQQSAMPTPGSSEMP